MATWYRVHASSDVKFVFSGDGGLHVAGRWNHLGRKVVYCADSIALSTLEWLPHNGLSVSKYSYHRYSINIPDKLVQQFSANDLPANWDACPANDSTRDFADTELFNNTSILAIQVPSIMVPEEFCLVINATHPDFNHAYKTAKAIGHYIAPARK